MKHASNRAAARGSCRAFGLLKSLKRVLFWEVQCFAVPPFISTLHPVLEGTNFQTLTRGLRKK